VKLIAILFSLKIVLLVYLFIQITHKYFSIFKERTVNEAFKLISDLGFPIAAAMAGGYFVYLTIKLLLAGVLSSVKGMAGIITALDNRVKTMNHDVVRIDAVVSNALGLRPDVERIARADGKNDARRD
jgi:archaellum biogenesis ATPase FlaH